MNKLSVTIITKNEESNIKRCLESVKWANEILVADSGSNDRTKEICQSYNCKFIETEWLGFSKTKQFAVQNTSNDWVLSIDADEVISTELQSEIKQLLNIGPQCKGYRIRRKSFYLGRQIRHCGWDKDYTLRLFNKKYGSFNDKLVHESVQINGDIGNLKQPMLHYTYPTLGSHFAKMRRYSELGADTLYNHRKISTISYAILRGFLKFIKMYIFQFGFLDGKTGFLLSFNSAWGVYLKYLLLWEKIKSK